jgi:FkbM family methyltransferase
MSTTLVEPSDSLTASLTTAFRANMQAHVWFFLDRRLPTIIQFLCVAPGSTPIMAIQSRVLIAFVIGVIVGGIFFAGVSNRPSRAKPVANTPDPAPQRPTFVPPVTPPHRPVADPKTQPKPKPATTTPKKTQTTPFDFPSHVKHIPITATAPASTDGFALTRSVPPFYINPKRQEYEMEFYNTMLMLRILGDNCMPYDESEPATYVDIGAFFGWYSVWAAKLGCKVVTFEPNAERVFDQQLLALNGVADRVTLFSNPVSDEVRTVEVHGSAEQAFYAAGGSGGSGEARHGAASGTTLQTARLVDVIPTDTALGLIKIDTEGAEALVLRSVLQLIDAGATVNDVIFECTPKVRQFFGVVRVLCLICGGSGGRITE